ncbi:helix-hairpin-helix domain-containing protein [Mucilaginibacter sp. BJC16-A38]|uniref:helix-hairpin-helix domain-containing protein n=1 Tax=Mucilaginibacter phenanthrenivorans TaxID=1234842 RepID=UPI00215734FB|nr:helix-hairpin-helix domain-containing protein [Mucilaginibacter phenanthrenivorans]MCR8559694.1 helix-hairpin-helix domain-containing protein [Mucilaginibacter phenanthrenivorans]
MKTRIKNYLSITKKEWNGLVILVVLIALVLASPYVYQLFRKDNTINFKEFDKAVAQINKAGGKVGFNADSTASGEKLAKPVMFPFNPNKLTIVQWKQLGLSEHQAEVIKHYVDKGGRFYTKEDVKKIYALTADDYKRLEPFIEIPETEHFSKKIKTGEVIELNTADSAKLTELSGIGGSFAIRIVRYRTRLGGFYKKEQLKEVYGIDSLKYDEIKKQVTVNAAKINKIAINTISFDQLRLFPYFSYKQVNAIIEYREQHGNYTSIDDLKNIVLLDDGILRKIEPYISFK